MPNTNAVDFYTWNRDFHGIRPRGARYGWPEMLSPAVRSVGSAIAAHVNNKSGHARIGVRGIAKSAQVAASTAKDAIDTLEAEGWLNVTRSATGGMNTYRLVSPVAALRAAPETSERADDEGVPITGTGVPLTGTPVPLTGTELRSSLRKTTTRDEEHSVDAVARTVGAVDKSNEPTVLPDDWAPGRFHRSTAERLGINVDIAAAHFAAGMRADGERRSDWGKAFGAFLAEVADGDTARTFGIPDPLVAEAEAVTTAWIAENTPAPVVEVVEAPAPVAPVVEPAPVVEAPAPAPAPTITRTPAPAVVEPDTETEAVREAHRRARIERDVNGALLGGLRRAERAHVAEMIDDGHRAPTIAAAIKDHRREHKARAARDLAHAHRAA